KHIEEGMREIRIALLEADVNFKVVKSFIESVQSKCLNQEVLDSLTPGQQVVKIVRDELIHLLGDSNSNLTFTEPPTVYMLVGLQGSGKTTTAGKLALWLRKQGHSPYLVSTDVYRPAAMDQLAIIAKQTQIPFYPATPDQDPVAIAKKALYEAKNTGYSVLIVDTAGRLHLDDDLMKELQRMKEEIQPKEILFIADAMTGQDAVKSGDAFNKALDLSGLILTKMDGDAKGGAALSIRMITQKPIKMVGTGEKVGDFEVFYPDRLASRILGMGDILSLIEKAEEAFDRKQAEKLEKKLRKEAFTLEDFRDQLLQIKKMGPISQILGMLPGVNSNMMKNMNMDENALVRIEAIINSMTPAERNNHSLINGSRRKRIAKGSGTSVEEVNRLLKQFVQAQKMIKQVANMDPKKMRFPFPR
ncbi:MAG TPA: signal recognition particle protein, partial [Acidobacteriota bacterium]|nr:signal recognition particle protein [Acidobacteriota bacterium]